MHAADYVHTDFTFVNKVIFVNKALANEGT